MLTAAITSWECLRARTSSVVLRSIFGAILSLLNSLRRWLTMIVAILLLGITVASHTIGFVNTFVTSAISMVAEVIPSKRGDVSRLETQLATATADLNRSQQTIAAQNAELNSLRLSNARQGRHLELLQSDHGRLMRETYVEIDGQRLTVRHLASQTIDSVQNRTRRVAASNLGSMLGESIPFYGIAIVVAATTIELTASCQNMTELYELQVAVDPESAIPDDRDEVCGLQVPTVDELWTAIKASPGQAWAAATNAIEAAPGWLGSIPTPDFSGRWQAVISWFSGWF